MKRSLWTLRILGALTAVLLCPLVLSGCGVVPQSREVGETTVLEILGAEPAGEDLYLRAASAGRPGSPPERLASRGPSPAAAVERLFSGGFRPADCAHIEHILLDASAGALPQMLSYTFREPQQSTESQLWIVRSTGLAPVFAKDQDPAQRMRVIKAAGKDRQGFRPVTLREAARTLAQGDPLLVPALGLGPDGLDFIGYALCRPGQPPVWLTGRYRLGAALLLGDPIHWTGTAKGCALSLQSTRSELRLREQNGILTGLDLVCHLEGVPVGGWQEADLSELEGQIYQSLEGALTLCQQAGADGAGLGRQAALQDPWRWAKVSRQWETTFSTLPISVSVTITVAERC